MLDCQLFGLKAGGHHFTNVCLHTVAVLLLFLLLQTMTCSLWRSAFIATVFAIHPLRVESVAWISERKDVLSALFFMLTLGAYVRYVRRPSPGRYIAMAISFALGLMSKPMLVTTPIVLLLLDYWPLNRVRGPTATGYREASAVCAFRRVMFWYSPRPERRHCLGRGFASAFENHQCLCRVSYLRVANALARATRGLLSASGK
jgi:4-amino-4-deoxy-L-arabinose transferase-like glycosyltransferase